MKTLDISMSEYQYRLLPCPFCGSQEQSLEEIDEEDERRPPKIILTCLGCGVQHHNFETDSDEPMDEAIEEIIHLWNCRKIADPGPCSRCGSKDIIRVVETYIGDSGTHHKCVGYCCESCGKATTPDNSEYHALRNWAHGW